MTLKMLKKLFKKQIKLLIFATLLTSILSISFSKNEKVLAAEGTIIYLDLAKGNVTINNSGYSGINEYGVSVSGQYDVNNIYHIFQSYEGWSYELHGIPEYDRVEYNGQLWSSYITNKSSVFKLKYFIN